MPVKAPGGGDESRDPGCVAMRCANELRVASAPAPAEIRWAFLRMVTSKSLVPSCTVALQGSISVSGIKGDQTSSGCLFFLILLFFIFNAYFLLAVTSSRQVSGWFLGLPADFFSSYLYEFPFFLLVLMHPDVSLMISHRCCAPSASELGVKCAFKHFALISPPAVARGRGGVLCARCSAQVGPGTCGSSGLGQLSAFLSTAVTSKSE